MLSTNCALIPLPQVRMLGDSAAIVTYVRLVQVTTPAGGCDTIVSEETRVWEKGVDGGWVNVHIHRSQPGA